MAPLGTARHTTGEQFRVPSFLAAVSHCVPSMLMTHEVLTVLTVLIVDFGSTTVKVICQLKILSRP
jgi:hypothetical protein